ncbi:MAG: tyrosine-type recombinase/integrase [Erysipelotrichaceae bacterium]|nr:tyrosine-type recombinase/integrase [Erysipelotrichaceae bacterium]
MAVVKKNNKWYIKGKIKKDDGSYYQYTKLAQGCKLQKEAKEYERLFRMQYQDIQASSHYITFKELSDEYIKTLISVKKSTLRSYQDKLDKITTVLGDKKINLITKTMLETYIRGLEEIYASEYVEKFYYQIRAVFNYGIENEYIQTNPMNKVKLKVNKDSVKKEMNFWEPDEFDRFIKKVEDQELKTLYLFLYYMGTRKGEAMALQWKDIDFKNDVVRIYKTVTNKIKGSTYAITSPKTQNSNRNIPMFKIVKDSLLEWKEVHKKMYGFSEECFVFGYYRPLHAERPRRYMIKVLDNINKDLQEDQQLKQIRIHDFRHSHASWLINNMGKYNFSDYDIAKRLGDTVQMLHSTYAHQFKNAGRNIIESMENDMSKPKESEQKAETKPNKYDELIELKKLLDIGVITQAEFDAKKKQVLGL